MKASYIFAALAAFYGVEATTHVVCTSCPHPTSTNDMVTRSDEPVPSCTVPLIVPVNGTMTTSAGGMPTGGMPTGTGGVMPTQPPMAAANKLTGVLGGTAAFAVAAALLI